MNDLSNIIHEVTQKADIVNIISRYVKLEKKGAGYFGLCPFHDDKNPSLSVSPSRQMYKCFSCNAAGNVIKFVADFKKIPFMEALREVATSVNIQIKVSKAEQDAKKNEKYYKVMTASQNFYTFYLHNTIDGKKALEYLERRGLNDELVKQFNIGLAPNDNDLLYQSLTKQGYLALDMAEVGLVRLSENYYDLFRARIMFPITDLLGRIVGYSGRRYLDDNNKEAKYINTHETVIFKKGQILYNYYESFADIKKSNSVYLFEGFMDVFAAYQVGIKNAVASMGTALTFDQIKALKRVTNNIIICYDGDNPGVEATIRAIKMLATEHLEIQVVTMPEELDPDDYLRKYGVSKLKDLLTLNLTSGPEFIYQIALKDFNVKDVNSIEKLKTAIFQFLKSFPSNTIRDIYLKKLSELINVDIKSLYSDYDKTINEVISDEYIPIFDEPLVKQAKKISLQNKFLNIQKNLICLAFYHQEKLLEIDNSFNAHYVIEELREIMNKALEKAHNNKFIDLALFTNELSEQTRNCYLEIINMPIKPNIINLNMYIEEFEKWPYRKAIEANSGNPDKIEKVIEYRKKITKIKKRSD